ncbi:hypothetical protein KJ611_03930 [Patescibacteria group bacterium]|nr:hypothetical protein [Patescibacteria group bacterium]MBU1705815.1 hypothetical protein [Patescibacteria group bacterium]
MSPIAIVESVLEKRAQSLLGDALFNFVRQMDRPDLNLADKDVDFAEFFDELQDIVLFSAEVCFQELNNGRQPPRQLKAVVSGSARRHGDRWDIGAVDVNDVIIS